MSIADAAGDPDHVYGFQHAADQEDVTQQGALCLEGQAGYAPGSGAVLDGLAFLDRCQEVSGQQVLADPDDGEVQELLDDLLAMTTVDPDWRRVDLVVPSDPVVVLHLRSHGLDLRFVTMITAFQAPQNVLVEHVRIETWLPYDDATADACRDLRNA